MCVCAKEAVQVPVEAEGISSFGAKVKCDCGLFDVGAGD